MTQLISCRWLYKERLPEIVDISSKASLLTRNAHFASRRNVMVAAR